MTRNGALEVCHVDEGPKDAPVVVLSNSLGSTLSVWDPLLPALHGFRVIRYDHRGHGGSPVPPGPYTMADLGGDLIGLLDRLRVERASIVGISLGGMVGMWAAANASSRVERLVLICTSARLGPAAAWHERATIVRRDGTSAVAGAVVARWLTKGFTERQPGVANAMRTMIASTPDEGYSGCCEAIAEWDFEDRLDAIRAPTLLIAGSVDEATPPSHSRAIASRIAGARVVVVDDAAHVPVIERPERIAVLLQDHLSALISTKRRPS